MSILIKNMEMPKSCNECPLYTCMHNYNDCPLIPVPPHGDLIDRDALIKDGWLNLHDAPCRACSICDVLDAVEDAPTADVRPVVTCADCKYNKREVTDLWGNDAIQCITGQTHRHDWFCADGERRSNA